MKKKQAILQQSEIERLKEYMDNCNTDNIIYYIRDYIIPESLIREILAYFKENVKYPLIAQLWFFLLKYQRISEDLINNYLGLISFSYDLSFNLIKHQKLSIDFLNKNYCHLANFIEPMFFYQRITPNMILKNQATIKKRLQSIDELEKCYIMTNSNYFNSQLFYLVNKDSRENNQFSIINIKQ